MRYRGSGSKIMIAESDRAILEMLQVRLDVAGYHPIGVRTGAAALEILKNMRPSALVLDLHLPDIDGLRLLTALNSQPERIPTPTLLIGRKLAAEDIMHAVRLGARDCLQKPFSGTDILDRISRMLNKQSAQDRRPAHYLAS